MPFTGAIDMTRVFSLASGRSCMRKRTIRRTLVVTCLLVLVALVAADVGVAAQSSRSTVIVREFTFRDTVEMEYQRTFKTSALTEKLKTALVQTRRFDVLERQDMDMIDEEIAFAKSSSADASRGPRDGMKLGAAFIVTGEIAVVDVGTDVRAIPSTKYFNHTVYGRIVCDMRVIDTAAGTVVTAAKIEAAISDRQRSVSSSAENVASPLFYDDLYRELTEKIALKIIESVYPLKIAAVDGSTVYLNRGEGSGLEPSQVLAVYEMGKTITDSDTGEVLGQTESYVGEIQVVKVNPKNTMATLLSEGAAVRKGMIVRPPE